MPELVCPDHDYWGVRKMGNMHISDVYAKVLSGERAKHGAAANYFDRGVADFVYAKLDFPSSPIEALQGDNFRANHPSFAEMSAYVDAIDACRSMDSHQAAPVDSRLLSKYVDIVGRD